MNNKKQYEEYQPILKKIEQILAKFLRSPIDINTSNVHENNGNLLDNSNENIDYMYNVTSESILDDISILRQTSNTHKVLDFNVYLKCFIHELRTPISTISMGLHLLENGDMSTENTQIIHDLFQSISFIENIFSKFAIIQDGNIVLNTFEPFSLNGIIQDIKNLLFFSIQETKIHFEWIIDSNVYDWVYGDKYNMKHVIINLLKNAIKYRDTKLITANYSAIIIHITISPTMTETKKDNSSELHCDIVQPQPPPFIPPSIRSSFLSRRTTIIPNETVSDTYQTIQISISDNNPHILPHIKQNLFETFNSTSGSGLGLYICKTIIELHAGTIVHDYIKPIGNKFMIELSMKCCDELHQQKNITIIPNVSKSNSLDPITDSKPVSICDDHENRVGVSHIPMSSASVARPGHSAFGEPESTTNPPSSSMNGGSRSNPGLPGEALTFRPSWSTIDYSSMLQGKDEPDSVLLPNKKPNVVLVDDSHLNRKMMYKILLQTNEFNQIYATVDGDKCIQLMLTYDNINTDIQIILLDKYMPVMDGIVTAKKLRELGYKNLIIGITGTVDPNEINEFIQNGADYVLTKPMDNHKIKLLITFIKSYGTHRPQNKIIHCANNQMYWA